MKISQSKVNIYSQYEYNYDIKICDKYNKKIVSKLKEE